MRTDIETKKHTHTLTRGEVVEDDGHALLDVVLHERLRVPPPKGSRKITGGYRTPHRQLQGGEQALQLHKGVHMG